MHKLKVGYDPKEDYETTNLAIEFVDKFNKKMINANPFETPYSDYYMDAYFTAIKPNLLKKRNRLKKQYKL